MSTISEIRIGSEWIVKKEFSLIIGTHSRNENGTEMAVSVGDKLIWDGDAPNGNIWFIHENGERGKTEHGYIIRLINQGLIELLDNKDGFLIYNKSSIDYISQYG